MTSLEKHPLQYRAPKAKFEFIAEQCGEFGVAFLLLALQALEGRFVRLADQTG